MPVAARCALRAGCLALAVTATSPPAHPRADAHAAARWPAIVAELGGARTDAVLLMGNSHAEMAGEARPDTCAPVINAGIGGARARDYAAALPRMRPPVRPRLAVLLIGTNDILRGGRPLSAVSRARFAADSAAIIAWMQARAGGVIVAAVPPIGVVAARKRDPAAVAVYSEILRELCRAPSCRFADPFAGLRDGDGGLAAPPALTDAIHLADYPAMLASLGLCGPAEGGAARPAAPPPSTASGAAARPASAPPRGATAARRPSPWPS